MNNTHIYMLLAGIFGFNLYLLLVRRARTRKNLRDAVNKRAAAEQQIEEIKKRLEREQNEAVRRVEKQNKTFEMYEQVRRRAEEEKNPYEDEEFYDKMPDALLRPGGFELTRRLLILAGFSKDSAQRRKILDVGCGAGATVRFLAKSGFCATGVDKSEKLIELSKQMVESEPFEAEFFAAHGEALPFEDSCFDAVLFECSLSLMDAAEALRESKRVLKDGGFLLVSDVFRGVKGTGGMMTLDDFTGLLRQNGFEVNHTEDKTNVFESFIAQVIMSTGSLDTLFDCDEWTKIKEARPRYCLITASKKSEGG